MLNVRIVELSHDVIKYAWVGMLVSLLFSIEVFVSYYSIFGTMATSYFVNYINWSLYVEVSTNMELLGQIIYTIYSPLFIIASIILLVAMIVLLY